MVKQAVIAAGGRGTRMSQALNPFSSKHLMEHNGKTMFEYLIDSLEAGGITDFLIGAGEHNIRRLCQILERKGLNATVRIVSGGYKAVPSGFFDVLEEQVLYVCGHHPLPAQFVRTINEASHWAPHVITTYNLGMFPPSFERGIIFEEGSFREVTFATLEGNPQYLRNPYVITKKMIIQELERCSTGGYVTGRVDAVHLGLPIRLIPADFPPEFDFDHEFRTTQRFLDTNFGQMDA